MVNNYNIAKSLERSEVLSAALVNDGGYDSGFILTVPQPTVDFHVGCRAVSVTGLPWDVDMNWGTAGQKIYGQPIPMGPGMPGHSRDGVMDSRNSRMFVCSVDLPGKKMGGIDFCVDRVIDQMPGKGISGDPHPGKPAAGRLLPVTAAQVSGSGSNTTTVLTLGALPAGITIGQNALDGLTLIGDDWSIATVTANDPYPTYVPWTATYMLPSPLPPGFVAPDSGWIGQTIHIMGPGGNFTGTCTDINTTSKTVTFDSTPSVTITANEFVNYGMAPASGYSPVVIMSNTANNVIRPWTITANGNVIVDSSQPISSQRVWIRNWRADTLLCIGMYSGGPNITGADLVANNSVLPAGSSQGGPEYRILAADDLVENAALCAMQLLLPGAVYIDDSSWQPWLKWDKAPPGCLALWSEIYAQQQGNVSSREGNFTISKY